MLQHRAPSDGGGRKRRAGVGAGFRRGRVGPGDSARQTACLRKSRMETGKVSGQRMWQGWAGHAARAPRLAWQSYRSLHGDPGTAIAREASTRMAGQSARVRRACWTGHRRLLRAAVTPVATGTGRKSE
ncbi:unnamed protein product [Ostreobium quekettii]|uniref:Uncharacterized protein n=1 Tax=Ostreobium quekettii TaxID=121088 RepID=A0A8S1JFH3_9CHLO|nr:unnamed protein product [Ostreobium quekettii]